MILQWRRDPGSAEPTEVGHEGMPASYCLCLSFFPIFKRFYLFIHKRHREAETQAEGEAGSLQKPDVGLDPRTLGSWPEPKADAQPLSHPGSLKIVILIKWRFPMLSFIGHAFNVVPKKSSPPQGHLGFLLWCPLGIFIILCFTFSSVIHFWLIFG